MKKKSITHFSYKFIDESSVTLCRIWIYDYKEHNYEHIQEKKKGKKKTSEENG